MTKKQSKKESPKKTVGQSEILDNKNPLIFISHDSRDAGIAAAFSELLTNSSAGILKSFYSSDNKGVSGIDYGIEWYKEIIVNIKESTNVVCLLTENSINKPWILYEAGLAKGAYENSPLIGVAIGIPISKANTGPFAQFQNSGDDEDSLCKLVNQLIKQCPMATPIDSVIKAQIKIFKDEIKKIIPKGSSAETSKNKDDSNNKNDTSKLFEEIKIMFQELPSRMEKQINFNSLKYKENVIFSERIYSTIRRIDNPRFAFICTLSYMKIKIPCIYDIGIETLKEIEGNKSNKEKMKAADSFIDFLRSQFSERSIYNVREYDFVRDFLDLLERAFKVVVDVELRKEK